MSNLKSLKTRIKSVKSTQKITKAMKMVAASRLKKAKLKLDNSREYSAAMNEMISDLVDSCGSSELSAANHDLLIGSNSKETHLLVVISSDRGLCGGLNGSVVKHVRSFINTLISQGRKVKIFCVGKKAYEQLKSKYSAHIIGSISGVFSKSTISYENALEIGEKLAELYEKKEFDVCEVVYSKFKSAISQEQKTFQLIPIQNFVATNYEGRVTKAVEIEFEPQKNEILSGLLVKNISIQIYNFLLENAASEQGARMSAMESASTNAGKLIKTLTLQYNRTRQANITRELIDIVSGANVV